MENANLKIKAMQIQGVAGDIEIAATDAGALITTGDRVVCEVAREENREARFDKARRVAGLVYGSDRRGPKATNSMVHDVLDAIERVAGC